MLLTAVAFFALTAVLVKRHLKQGAAAPAPAGLPAGPPCPRCQAPVPAGSTFCPGCGVPQAVYEVVSAAAAKDDDGGAAAGARKHAVVRADLCVGCGTCVAACPNAGALKMVGKLAVVDLALCDGSAKCVEACPTNSIIVSAGGATHRVEVPDVNASFETNVPGIYIVGELGGRGLIKNAINEGKIAIEQIAKDLPPGAARDDGDEATLDVLIVGSGPAGLSAALEAHRTELNYLVVEQGTLADTIRKYPRHKALFAEPIHMPLYGELWVADATKESLLAVWETIVANTGLNLKTHHPVRQILRVGNLFQVDAGPAQFKARRVVLALGRRGTPRRLGVRGEDLGKVVYDVTEMEEFAGRRVIVVGGGDSAIESVLGLANQPGTRVALSYRGDAFKRVKDRNRARLDAAVNEGRVLLLLKSEITEVREDSVSMIVDGKELTMPNDDVIVRIGGDPPFPFLERIGVRMVRKDVPLPQQSEATLA